MTDSHVGPPWANTIAGRLEEHVVDSQALTGNPLGDPHVRPLYVQLPPGYDDDGDRRYPTIFQIQGLTGQVDMWRNRKAFQPNVPERIDAEWRAGRQPAIVVYVDAWTRLGGSQYLDSPGTGRYHTYLCEELVPFVDERYRTLAAREHRGVVGKSSGGYGAMVTAMLRPDLFAGLATHAGDALFEVCYWPDAREAARALRDEYDGSYDAFWADFRSRPGRPRKSDGVLLNMYCMAACYSAEADGSVRLPFDPATGEMVRDAWERWLEHDPVRMAAQRGDALRSMRAIWIDAGKRDEFYLDLGAEAFRGAVRVAGVAEDVVRFELYDATHADLEWRYPMSIAWLADRLA
ncbi:MAG TPA: alpha/beta hydrolase-fold protein [Candidatus Limnocylindria bacterium]|nr:alpha/beta hydrolase-fold protein [Candidatus Limnocylindria bacterium]